MTTSTQEHLTTLDSEAAWTPLVAAIRTAQHTLSTGALTHLITALPAMTPALPGKKEFLLPLDAAGQPLDLPVDALASLRTALDASADLCRWLKLVPHHGKETVLVARTLCHRIGIRHGTVELILDHPTRANYTFLQIRGFHKDDAPGAFDLPCAGHAVACDTAEASLQKELNEEIGIQGADLAELRCVGEYEHCEATNHTDFINVEYRTVFRARLKSQSMAKLNFADGEVAALTMITRAALHELVTLHPDRIASGLLGSLRWYHD